MFELVKWYLDLVTDCGSVLVGYSVHCRLGPAGFRYASLLHAAPDAPAIERTTLPGARAPVLEGDTLRWHVPRLRFDGAWQRLGPPLAQTLLDEERGRIEWHCHLPRARATARFGDEIIAGMGYAEELRVTCPPWQLPFRTLRWGRYHSPERGLVWIEWKGELERRWIWFDGRAEPGATLGEQGISGLSDRRALQCEDPRALRDRQVLETLTRILPSAMQEQIGPLGGMRERKWVARSVLTQDGVAVDRGWTVHEEVRW
jgi:hypothetical protein